MNPLQDAARAVANAKLDEFTRQAWKLAGLVGQGTVEKNRAVDQLIQIWISNGLELAHGEGRAETIITAAFADCEFHPMRVEKVG